MTAMSDGSSSAEQAPERVLRGGPAALDALDRVDLLEKNLGRQIEAIRASDIKITFLVPTLTGMLGFLAANVTRAAPGSPTVAYTLLSAAPLVLAYAFLALTVIPGRRRTADPTSFSAGSRASPLKPTAKPCVA